MAAMLFFNEDATVAVPVSNVDLNFEGMQSKFLITCSR